MRRRKGPKKKKKWTAAKKELLKRLGKKRLSPTRQQRESHRKALEGHLKYKIPKLSEVVSKPSHYTVKKRAPKYEVEKEWRPAERKIVGYRHDPYMWHDAPVYETVRPAGNVVVSKKQVGEKLIVKRLRKKGPGKGGGSGERVSHKTGTSQAKKSRAKMAKMGMRPGHEPKKAKSKKKKGKKKKKR